MPRICAALVIASAVACLLLSTEIRDIFHDAYHIVSGLIERSRLMKHLVQKAKPRTSPSLLYVALGSSFAAAPLVGETVPNALGLDQGSLGYPFLLANKLGLNSSEFANAASSGATLSEVHELQLHHLGPQTRLVTLTAGGNDVDYTRDSVMSGFLSRLRSSTMQSLSKSADPLKKTNRPFDKLGAQFDATLSEIKRRAPQALIVVVTYISIMPPSGALHPLSEHQTSDLRRVGEHLREVTIEAANRNGVMCVDMALASKQHSANSPEPWCHGYSSGPGVASVHPNEAGHAASADCIFTLLKNNGFSIRS